MARLFRRGAVLTRHKARVLRLHAIVILHKEEGGVGCHAVRDTDDGLATWSTLHEVLCVGTYIQTCINFCLTTHLLVAPLVRLPGNPVAHTSLSVLVLPSFRVLK